MAVYATCFPHITPHQGMIAPIQQQQGLWLCWQDEEQKIFLSLKRCGPILNVPPGTPVGLNLRLVCIFFHICLYFRGKKTLKSAQKWLKKLRLEPRVVVVTWFSFAYSCASYNEIQRIFWCFAKSLLVDLASFLHKISVHNVEFWKMVPLSYMA